MSSSAPAAPSPQGPEALSRADTRFFVFNAVVSAAALALLAYLLLWHGGMTGTDVDLRFMPAVNAGMNALCATLLTAGWIAIRRGNKTLHKYLMVAGFAASALFLVGYLAYHAVHGDTKFAGEGLIRGIYLSILASHVLLSMPVVPAALTLFYFAFRGSFQRHKKVGRVALPVWIYVSVTGVVVFFMLRGSQPSHVPASAAAAPAAPTQAAAP